MTRPASRLAPADWETMGPARRAWEAVGGALLLGVLTGLALAVSTALYLVGVVIAVAGGVMAGAQHRRPAQAAVRGLVGGLAFGAGVLAGVQLSGTDDPALALPDPEALYLVLAAAPAPLLHLLGWRLASWRRRHRR